MTAQILVVDDEPDLEELIQQKFRRQIRDGAVTFHFARDGIEALAALKSNGAVDMVVTDINMPRMDGLTLLQKLQEGEEKISTIIVSAYGDMTNIRTAMNRGAFDFLTKPIDFPDLETTIAKTIRHIEILREARRRQATAERAHASLSRYFSPSLAQRLASDTETLDLRGQRRQIATLFTDIAGALFQRGNLSRIVLHLDDPLAALLFSSLFSLSANLGSRTSLVDRRDASFTTGNRTPTRRCNVNFTQRWNLANCNGQIADAAPPWAPNAVLFGRRRPPCFTTLSRCFKAN